MTTKTATGTDIEDGKDSKAPHGPGEFDQDEPDEVLGNVMASKSSVHPSQVQASTGSSSGNQPTTSMSAISQQGGGPLVSRRTEQVCVELLGLIHNH